MHGCVGLWVVDDLVHHVVITRCGSPQQESADGFDGLHHCQLQSAAVAVHSNWAVE